MLTCSTLIMYSIFHKSVNASSIDGFNQISDLLLLAVFSTAIAYMIFFRLLSSVGAIKVLLVTFLIPISASFLGVVLLGDVFTTNMYIGTASVFIALFLIMKDKK